MGGTPSARYELGEMDDQNSGLSAGDPYSLTSPHRHPANRPEDGGAPGVARQLVTMSAYGATTPPQMTAALMSFDTTSARSVICPPMEWPHMPMRFGSASL